MPDSWRQRRALRFRGGEGGSRTAPTGEGDPTSGDGFTGSAPSPGSRSAGAPTGGRPLVYSVVELELSGLFGVVGLGMAMEDALWMLPLSYGTERYSRTLRSGAGRPARLGRYTCPLPLTARRPGPIRAGLRQVGFAWGMVPLLKDSPKGAGSSCRGPTGVICSTLPERPGAGSNGGNDYGGEGHREGSQRRSGPSPRAHRERPARFAWASGLMTDLDPLMYERG